MVIKKMNAIIYSVIETVRSPFLNRFLIFQMIKREVLGRYKNSMIGMLWTLINPLMLLVIYVFVFSVIFHSRWGENTSNLEFAGILFAGLIIYQFFSECMNRSSLLITENVNYVKKVVFPVEILPLVAMGSAFFQLAINVCVLFVYLLFVGGGLEWTALLLPIVLLPFILLIIGLMWILAAIGVYVRDVAQIVGIITMGMLFPSPVLYPASAFPDAYKIIFYLNPLTFIIEQSRNVLLWGKVPDIYGLGMYFGVGCFFAVLGFLCFQKAKQGFADVL